MVVNVAEPLTIPPVVVSNAAGPDAHTVADDGVTVTAPGILNEFTVDVTTLVQVPLEYVYEIMVDPSLTGVTTPVVPMVATAGVDELHEPPEVAFVKVIVVPLHTDPDPDIADTIGSALIVIAFTAKPVQLPLV